MLLWATSLMRCRYSTARAHASATDCLQGCKCHQGCSEVQAWPCLTSVSLRCRFVLVSEPVGSGIPAFNENSTYGFYQVSIPGLACASMSPACTALAAQCCLLMAHFRLRCQCAECHHPEDEGSVPAPQRLAAAAGNLFPAPAPCRQRLLL